MAKNPPSKPSVKSAAPPQPPAVAPKDAIRELAALHALFKARVQGTGDEWDAINASFGVIASALQPKA